MQSQTKKHKTRTNEIFEKWRATKNYYPNKRKIYMDENVIE